MARKPLVNPNWSRDEAFILGVILGLMMAVIMGLMVMAALRYPWEQLTPTGWVILSSLLLFGVWNTYRHWRSGRVYLVANETSDDKKAQPLVALTEQGYHCDFKLEDGVNLHYSDGDISINFDHPSKAYEFIRKTKLKVDTTLLSVKLEKAEALAAALKALKEFAE